MKTWLQASAVLLVSVAVLLASVEGAPGTDEGATNTTFEITNGDDLYQKAQTGNGNILHIAKDMVVTRKVFLTSITPRVYGDKNKPPLLDCMGKDTAFVVNAQTSITVTDITIGGCINAAVTVQGNGAKLTLENVVFRNHKSIQPGAALLIMEGATVIGSKLRFSSITALKRPDASVIHVKDGGLLELSDSEFEGIATEGSLISTDTGSFYGDKITVGPTNRLGGDAIKLVGCGGQPNKLTNSQVDYAPYDKGANTFINAFATGGGQPNKLVGTSNPAILNSFDAKTLPGSCTLDISGTTFENNLFLSALISADGFGIVAKDIKMRNNSEAGTPPVEGTVPDLIKAQNAWINIDGAEITDNKITGRVLTLQKPTGPAVLNGATISKNEAADLIFVDGQTRFLDKAAWTKATGILPDQYWPTRGVALDEDDYNTYLKNIALYEGIRDASMWRMPLVLQKGVIEGNTVSGLLVNAAGKDENGLVVRIDGTQFTDNTVGTGPAVQATVANVSVVKSTFSGNKAPQGLLRVSDGTLRLQSSNFEQNTVGADSPGAVSSEEGSLVFASAVRASQVAKSTFTDNIAPSYILRFEDSGTAISDSTFKGNTAGQHIVAASNTDVAVKGFVAEGNTAQATLFLDHTPLQVTDSTFTNNNAAGLLTSDNEPMFTKQPGVMTNLLFEGNVIDKRMQGSAVVLAPSMKLPIRVFRTKFIGNTIQNGVNNATGGLYAGGSDVSASVNIASSTFKQNVGAFGGGLWTTLPTVVNQSEFTGNRATYSGGAIYGEASKLTVGKSTIISYNTAGSGGGLTCKDCQVLNLRNIDVTGNAANESLVPESLATDAPSIPCVTGGGGGICVETSEGRDGQETNISQVSFRKNGGKFGGGVYLGNACDKAQGVCYVNLDRLSSQNNTAGQGGGDDLYATSYVGIQVCCAVRKTKEVRCTPASELELDTLDVGCSPDGEVVVKAGDGTRVATIPARIIVTSKWANKAVASGSTMLEADITLVDNKGKPVQSVPKELVVEIDSARADMTVIGNRSVPFGDSPQLNIVGFQVLPSVSPSNQQYELRFQAAGTKYASRIIPGSFNVTIPQCTIGQYEFMFRCVECGTYNGQYSLTPSVRCEPCPTGANCSKGYVVPRSGYFQPNPLVPQLQECPLEGACRRSNATMARLITFVDGISAQSGEVGGFIRLRQDMTNIEDRFNKLQCAKGYHGRFCGVCSDGYGRWNTRCVKCASRSMNNWYLFLAIMFIVFLISITIASHLRAALYKRAPPPPVPRADSAESAGQPVENRRKVYDLEQILAEQARRKLDARLDVDQLTRQQEEEEQQKAVEAAQIEAERSSLHFSMLTALAKIMISYVQVVGMARGLDLNIPRPLRRFLSNYDYTSSLSWLSIECSLKGSPAAKAIKRTVITISLPVIIMTFFTLYWLTKYWRRRAKARSSSPGVLQTASQLTRSRRTSPSSFFANRMITTGLQVAFYTYPLVTSTLFRIFDCTKLRNCNSPTECLYRSNNPGAWKEGWFWTQSYDTQCFRGSHLQLIVGGTVGIAVFSIGVPLIFAFSIWLRRSKLEDPRTLLRFGFLYWEYRTSCHWWEAIITARKLALLMTTIFLRYTGRYAPSIQIYTSLMVLMVAVLLQEMFRPFEDELLNRMERLSLFTSATTLVLMAYYLVGPISSGVRLALSGIIMMINLAALLQFIVLILWELWLWLLEKLQIEPPESFKFSDMLEVSRKLRGRWKDVRAVVVDEWLMPSLVKTLNSRHSTNGRRRLPTSIPTQEDAT